VYASNCYIHRKLFLNARIKIPFAVSNIAVKVAEMKRFILFPALSIGFLGVLLSQALCAQSNTATPKSLEVSEEDGIPVLIKHLPAWESVRSQAAFVNNASTLRSALGQRKILELVDFTAGTEAVTAPYPAGRLLIIEYTNPQQSIEADSAFRQFLEQNGDGRTFYKRTGNYNIFVFDAADKGAADELISQVKYEKNIQWLGEDPFLFHNLERAFVNQTTDLFFSTVEVIVLGMGISVLGGLIVGFIYFQFRERQRQTFKQYSDAGGMTRLNLDGFTPDISGGKLLGE
jgi:hypothetical protein